MKILEDSRQISGDWHIFQAHRLLAFDAGRELDTVLVYVAVELRLAIERRMLEILLLLKEHQLSDKDVRRCRSLKGIAALMEETDKFYTKTMEFTRLVASTAPGVPEVSVLDLGYLRRSWHELSEYCHLQLKPEDSFGSKDRQFQRKGFLLVREIIERLMEWGTFGIVSRSSMPEEVRGIYDKFTRGEIDTEQAERMLVIAGPVLARRSALRS